MERTKVYRPTPIYCFWDYYTILLPVPLAVISGGIAHVGRMTGSDNAIQTRTVIGHKYEKYIGNRGLIHWKQPAALIDRLIEESDPHRQLMVTPCHLIL